MHLMIWACRAKGMCAMQNAVAAVLGICFRLFVDPKNPDSVVNTAATTVRQVTSVYIQDLKF